jgi:uncharacterized protein involved in response to NO
MLFFGGACQILLVMGWWLFELLARGTGSTGQTTVIPAAWAHVFLMLFGIFPFFIFGFLLTVYPRWMNGPVVPTRLYVGIFWLLAAGMLGFYPGLYLSKEVLALALAIELCGWGLALYALYSVFRRAHQHGAHEKILNLALFAGALGVAGYLYGVITGNAVAFLLAREAGLWLFLVPVVFLVSHRMLPFFSSGVLVNYAVKRPEWVLPLMLAAAMPCSNMPAGPNGCFCLTSRWRLLPCTCPGCGNFRAVFRCVCWRYCISPSSGWVSPCCSTDCKA